MNGNAAAGIDSRWTHVITIEPAFDVDPESPDVDPGAPLQAKPFFIQPYRNAFGEAPWDTPRVIDYYSEHVPHGSAIISR